VFPRPKRVRNPELIKKTRKNWCEFCFRIGSTQIHHIRAIGFSHLGNDIKENLTALCFLCHRKVHDGNLDREKLIEIVAERERKTPQEIREIIGCKPTLP